MKLHLTTPLLFIFFYVYAPLMAQSNIGYAVEVGAFEQKVALSYFSKMSPQATVYEVVDLNDIYRYWINCKTKELAEEMRQNAIQKGYVHARIIDIKALEKHCEASCGYTPPVATSKVKKEAKEEDYKIPTNEDFDKEDAVISPKKITKEDLGKSQFFDLSKDKMDCLFFDYKDPNLRPEAKKELDKAASVLLQKKNYQLKIYAHTDANGSDEYNYKLSETRAEIVHKYLIWRGVDATRITDGPYGERRPIAVNELPDGSDSPEGRQLNRRVEFVILDENGKEVDLIRPIVVPEYLKRK